MFHPLWEEGVLFHYTLRVSKYFAPSSHIHIYGVINVRGGSIISLYSTSI